MITSHIHDKFNLLHQYLSDAADDHDDLELKRFANEIDRIHHEFFDYLETTTTETHNDAA